MSRNNLSETNNDPSKFSYITNEQNSTGVYLNQHFLENISNALPNELESIGEAISCSDTEVVHALGQLNPTEQNSEIIPGPVINIDDLNETPQSLNLESYEQVVESYYRDNTALGPITMDDGYNDPDIRNNINILCNVQNLIPAEQRENRQLSEYRVVNANQSYSSTLRRSLQNQYSHNNNTFGVQEYDHNRSSSTIPFIPSCRSESDIKYCNPPQNKFNVSNDSKHNPRLIKHGENKYLERGSDDFEGLKPIRYVNRETYLNDYLKIINMKLKNTNSSNECGVVNDLRSVDNLNKDDIRHREEPRVKNTQIDQEAESYIDRNKNSNILNTERCQKKNFGKMFNAIDSRGGSKDFINDTEARKTFNVLEKYHKENMELKKSREIGQNNLTDIVGKIIDNLNDEISYLGCTKSTLSKKKDGVIEKYNLNNQTKNNTEKADKNILTVKNPKFDGTHKNVDDICGLIETYQHFKLQSGRSIEIIDLTNEDTADVRIDQDVDTGMPSKKLNDTTIISMVNEDKSSKNSKKHKNNKSKIENIILNEDCSVIDQRKTSEKKLHEHKSNKCDQFKRNFKHSETYTDRNSNKTDFDILKMVSAFDDKISDLSININQISNEQTSNTSVWTKRVYLKNDTDDDNDELTNGLDGIIYGFESSDTNKIRVKSISKLNETRQNEITNAVETVYGESCVGVQLNPNGSTKNDKSVTNVGEKTHNAHDEPSIRIEDSNETTESNFVDRSYRYKNCRSSIDLNKLTHNNTRLLHRGTNEDSLKSNTAQSLPNFDQQFDDTDDEHHLIIDTDTEETNLNEPFDDAPESPRDLFVDGRKSDEETVDASFMNFILNEDSENASELNKGLNNEKKLGSVENQDTEISKFIDEDVQLPNIQHLTSDGVMSADVQHIGEHFEMDYFYNIIKIKRNLFRVNLHTEDDIFNFIQLYSQRTQTSWRVLKSFKSRKYDVCKIFGCLHNGLCKLLKKQDKNIKINKYGCPSEIDIKIKCSTRGKKCDLYLKNGLPAVVKFKNKHNHLVPKVTDLPLLKSITDTNEKITLDNGFKPAKILQAYNIGNHPNLSPSVVDISNSSESNVDVETNNLSTCNRSAENEFFIKWENVKIQCDIVQSKNDGHLGPAQQIINNGKCTDDDDTPYQLVDTSYSKEYLRKLKAMVADHEQNKWLSNKIKTMANQFDLYKCSWKKCNAVFSQWKLFMYHLNIHCGIERNTGKNQEETCQFLICMYCFKSFGINSVDELTKHIFDNHSFSKFFCQYCLYRAYTASHVLIHQYIIHNKLNPSILELQDPTVNRTCKEVVKVVDFNKFVLRYVCNIGNCTFYSYTNSDFLYHLSQDHQYCDQFYCDFCDQCDGNAFISLNPTSYVKHFSLHSINTYQCIFCLFGAEFINLMIVHLAMEHFEYEPLCLERCPINNFCDNKKIENLKILNAKKCIPADIIKVVNSKSPKDTKENQMNETHQTDLTGICTSTRKNFSETFSLNKSMDQSKHISNESSDKIIHAGITYQDHLNHCPTETPIECTFCLAQSESTFDLVKFPKLLMSNCFICTFCDLELPSSDIAKSHVVEVHNISNVEFVPVNINATDIEKDRFLICEDKGLKRHKRANESIFCTEILKNMTYTHMKRSKIVNTHEDSQLNNIEIIENNLKKHIRHDSDESKQQQKTTKRKHSIESTDNLTFVGNKKKPSYHGLYDTSPRVATKYLSPDTIANIPQTPIFSELMGCLLCKFNTKLRSNLVLHLNWHTVEQLIAKNQILKNIPFQLKPIDIASKPAINSSCSSLEVKQNEKIRTVENSADDLILKSTIKPPSYQSRSNFPQFVPRNKRFKCPLNSCNFIGENMDNLKCHIRDTYYHSDFCYYGCPHCKPLVVAFESLHDLESHFNFHGIELYICLYCDYIHYNRFKIEAHQKQKHQLIKIDSDNKFSIVAIRSQNLDQPSDEWKCNLCMSGIKYTITQISEHLSIVHKISNMFQCPICKINNSNYETLEQHFKLKHPFMEVKYMNEYFDRISPNVKLQPVNKQTDEHVPCKENYSLNVLKTFDGVTVPSSTLHTPEGTPIKSLDVSEDQGKIVDNLLVELVDYLKFNCSKAKCECSVCSMVVDEKKKSSPDHLLKEINCTIWKCLKCLFGDPVETVKFKKTKHKQLKQKFEKIKINRYKCLVDGIIKFQNIIIEHESNNLHTDCDDQNGTKHGYVQ